MIKLYQTAYFENFKLMKILKITFSILIVLISFKSTSQDFDDILISGPEDMQLYLQNYIDPIMRSFNNGLATGWNNTAKPHKLFGFDLTFAGNIAIVPDGSKLWQFRNSDFTNIQTASGSEVTLPTILGGSTNEVLDLQTTVVIEDETFNTSPGSIPAADGIDLGSFAGLLVPTLQLGIGIVKNTDLKIRYVPSVETENLEFSLFGIGVLHDLKQWIPGIKKVPIDISGFIGYTGIKAEYFIADSELGDNEFSLIVDNGSAEFKASSTVIQILASKKISVLTPYIGVGYNINGGSFDLKGNYIYDSETASAPVEITNPVSLDFDGGSSATLTAGLRIKLLVLTLHADYTLQEYNTFSAGIGINVR